MKQVADYEELERLGLHRAIIGILHFDLDAHGSNARTCAGRREIIMRDKPTNSLLLAALRHCGSHAEALVEGLVVEVTAPKVVAWMYCTASFFSMGGNFVRLVLAVDTGIHKYMAAPVRAPPPEGASDLALELADYCVKNYKSFSDTIACDTWSSDEERELIREEDPQQEKAGRRKRFLIRKRHTQYIQTWKDFTEFWNGEIWKAPADPAPNRPIGPHYCKSPGCCNGYDLAVTHKRAVKVTRELVFRTQPKRPEKGKWTKMGPALDWQLLAQGVLGGLLNLFFEIAFGKLVTSEILRWDEDRDPDYLLDTAWHQVLGSRSKKVLTGLG